MKKTLAALAGTAILLGGASRAYASSNSGYSSVPSYTPIVAMADPIIGGAILALGFVIGKAINGIRGNQRRNGGSGSIPRDDEVRRNHKEYPGAIDVTPWDGSEDGPKIFLEPKEQWQADWKRRKDRESRTEDRIEELKDKIATAKGEFHLRLPSETREEILSREQLQSLQWEAKRLRIKE